jgi:hypothetical protein
MEERDCHKQQLACSVPALFITAVIYWEMEVWDAAIGSVVANVLRTLVRIRLVRPRI